VSPLKHAGLGRADLYVTLVVVDDGGGGAVGAQGEVGTRVAQDDAEGLVGLDVPVAGQGDFNGLGTFTSRELQGSGGQRATEVGGIHAVNLPVHRRGGLAVAAHYGVAEGAGGAAVAFDNAGLIGADADRAVVVHDLGGGGGLVDDQAFGRRLEAELDGLTGFDDPVASKGEGDPDFGLAGGKGGSAIDGTIGELGCVDAGNTPLDGGRGEGVVPGQDKDQYAAAAGVALKHAGLGRADREVTFGDGGGRGGLAAARGAGVVGSGMRRRCRRTGCRRCRCHHPR
jgi:hypothetical protein